MGNLIIPTITVLFLLYLLGVVFSNTTIKSLFFSLFFLFTLFCRYLIPYQTNADYKGYEYASMNHFKGVEVSLEFLFQEPYYKSLYEVLYFLSGNNNPVALDLVYKFNLLIVNIFIIWIAYRKDLLPVNKLLYFSFYYFLFSYTTLRNTPAYILISISFYNIQRNKNGILAAFSFLAHMSSLLIIPTIVSSFFKSKIANIGIFALGIVVVSAVASSPLFSLATDKFGSYTEYYQYGVSTSHKVYYATFIIITILLGFFYRESVWNKYYVYLFLIYLILNNVNGVMGYRYSVYVTIFLLMYPYKDTAWLNNKIIIFLSIIPFYLFYLFTYYQNHP